MSFLADIVSNTVGAGRHIVSNTVDVGGKIVSNTVDAGKKVAGKTLNATDDILTGLVKKFAVPLGVLGAVLVLLLVVFMLVR